MKDFEHSNFDENDLYNDFWVTVPFVDDDGEICEEQIGEVTLIKDITQGDMPFELEINGTIYKRED